MLCVDPHCHEATREVVVGASEESTEVLAYDDALGGILEAWALRLRLNRFESKMRELDPGLQVAAALGNTTKWENVGTTRAADSFEPGTGKM